MLERPEFPSRANRSAEAAQYGLVAQWTHWITALLIFAAMIIAWVMIEEARDNPSRPVLYTIHKALGVTIFTIVAFRILWRAANPAPPLPARFARWEAVIAKISHVLLYVVLVGLPISGFIDSQADGHPVSFFYLFDLPAIVPRNKALSELAETAHIWLQWPLYALIALHILATVWHVGVRRDGVLHRMLPKQINAE
ncbi:cytochrome b [Methylocapsa polymorpha]|uniref:Cytochrome b n=1 Tax=Methylocapsa polymorpha TaxID=3080828 RepID=A0ABZ0HRT7_9HYPH|nr:cytochrome b [Methylocapsa sp. RX1]